jgi:DedD protein
MGLFSFFKKNKQESTISQSHKDFYSTSDDDALPDRTRSRRRKATAANDDPMLPEKKRARRRLIGAVALVLAAVIGLPMILDPEPKTQTDDITLQIPSKDKAASLDAKEEIVEPPQSPPEPASGSEAGNNSKSAAVLVPAPQAVVKPAPVVEPKPEKKSEPVTEPKISSFVEKKADKPVSPTVVTEAKPVKPADAKPADSKSSDSKLSDTKSADHSDHDAARAMAILEGRSNSKSNEQNAAPTANKFVIQVAALASQEKVDDLRSKLKGASINSYTQKVATSNGEKIRVRVGPFNSREEADKMRAKLSLLGLNGTLIPSESH